MANSITSEEEQALEKLRESLLRDRPRRWPRRGEEAFRQHKLLASAVHRASRLHRNANDSETRAWIRYIRDFFPPGHNSEADGYLLWAGWRTSLLKDDMPLVPITHGQSHAHWHRDAAGRPCLNLEDAWGDFRYSVDRLIDHLRAHPEHRQRALRRFRETEWSVQSLPSVASASAAASATTMAPRTLVVESWPNVVEIDVRSPDDSTPEN